MDETRPMKRQRGNINTGSLLPFPYDRTEVHPPTEHFSSENQPSEDGPPQNHLSEEYSLEAQITNDDEQRQQHTTPGNRQMINYILRLLFLNQLVIQQLLTVLLLGNAASNYRSRQQGQDDQRTPHHQQEQALVIVENKHADHQDSKPSCSDADCHHQEYKKKYCYDLLKLLPCDVLLYIFSYIQTKNECLAFMMVSKHWLEQIPALTPHVWNYKRIKVDNSTKRAFNNVLLHQSLGPKVKFIEIENFEKQHDLFKMMEIIKSQGCTDLMRIRFRQCHVEDGEHLLNYLTSVIAQDNANLEFNEQQGSLLPILSIIQRFPRLEGFRYTEHEQQQSYNQSEYKSIMRNKSLIPSEFHLAVLIIGAFADVENPYPTGCSINCTSHQLTTIIKHAANLKFLILLRTGDNIDSTVIHAVAGLTTLKELGLFFDLEAKSTFSTTTEQKQQSPALSPMQFMALYTLFEKHAALGRSSTLSFLYLNVADDTITSQVSRIPLKNMNITDGLNLVSLHGIHQFAARLEHSIGGMKLEKMTLSLFDLRHEGKHGILRQFTRLPKLNSVDFSDCCVEMESYCHFVGKFTNLKNIYQPLFRLDSYPLKKDQEVTRIQDDNGHQKLFYWMVHKDDLLVQDYFIKGKRNPYVVMTNDLQKDFARLRSKINTP
ncbi:hypothetical protein BDA99DRAFT_542890 [Phascolomyces articulosus]|uniref:F-box domain-containing protein n=1 Tax=Phascolomyces articulosus TaxID=60185 RepID=A0AAD5JP68_9FUNG|nr:hypothetical protein BDA99DRAFT_542890 [Phascolomyces articulosus]